jgi:16S rRNA (cytosine967-C5)-methyltransferase
MLAEVGIEARETRFASHGIHVEKPVGVELLPEFEQGSVSIQDEAAQLAASVLEIPDPARVLDCCAAPGGKTAHILESHCGELQVVALDRSDHRVERLRQTLQRIGLQADVQVADAAGALDDWWDGLSFDRILLDAPCSSTGVIRRHPDIKIHRRAKDIENLVERQHHLLNSLWPVLEPGGKLIYATCSVLRAENDGVVSPFVERTRGARVDRIAADWGLATDCGRQIITGEDQMDGFYYARLSKE